MSCLDAVDGAVPSGLGVAVAAAFALGGGDRHPAVSRLLVDRAAVRAHEITRAILCLESEDALVGRAQRVGDARRPELIPSAEAVVAGQLQRGVEVDDDA